jgi:hypothetical protein
LSTYNYASNNPILNIDLWGLQGVKYYDKEKDRIVVEHNVVVLTQKPIAIPEGASKIKKWQITREISNNDRTNDIAQMKSDVTNYLNHGGEGAKNSAGETVFFKVNISEKQVSDPSDSKQTGKIGNENMLLGTTKNGVKTGARASVFTTATGSSLGSMSGNEIKRNQSDAAEGTYAHELSHRHLLPDNGYTKGGVLNSPPEPINTKEVDAILNKSFDKREK